MSSKTGTRRPCGCVAPCNCGPAPARPHPVVTPCSAALPGGLRRTRFYNGMLLDQSDFENQQHYWRVKRRLTNRALGQGIVWGLRARGGDSAPGNARDRVEISPGYALDCCGNDLVVECPVEVRVADLLTDAARCDLDTSRKVPRKAHLILEHVECPEDPRPVQTDVCAPEATRCEPTRIRESTGLRLVQAGPARPCALDVFEKELADLRNLCPELFPFIDTGGDTEPTEPAEPELHADLEARILNRQSIIPVPAGGAEPIRVDVPAGQQSIEIGFSLSPRAGWLMTAGKAHVHVPPSDDVGEAPQPELVDEIRPPYEMTLGWTWTIQLPRVRPGTGLRRRLTASITGWRLARWNGRSRSVTGDDLVISMEARVTMDSNNNQPQITLEIDIERPSVRLAEEPGGDCLDHLRPRTDWLEHPKAWLLAALHAWLTDLSGPREDRDGPWSAHRVAANWLYVLAWRLLFGADAVRSDDNSDARCQRQRLAILVHNLFQRWCDGLLYTGPRCGASHHGVVLACLEFDESWRLIRFDPICDRRYVLTGALLSHWACHLGLPSLDQMAMYLARSLCCIAGLPPPDLAQLPTYTTVNAVSRSDGPMTFEARSGALQAAFALSNHAYFSYGQDAGKSLEILNATVQDAPVRHSSLLAFAQLAYRALAEQQAPTGELTLRRHVWENGPRALQAFTAPPRPSPLPEPFPEPGPPDERNARDSITVVVRDSESWRRLPALARQPVLDAAVETVDRVPVAGLRALRGDDTASAVEEALRRTGIATLGAVLASDPERVSHAVWEELEPGMRSEETHAALIDSLYRDAEAAAEAVASAWVKAAASADQPVRRTSLDDARLVKRVRKSIETPALPSPPTLELLREAAVRAASRRPS